MQFFSSGERWQLVAEMDNFQNLMQSIPKIQITSKDNSNPFLVQKQNFISGRE
jgi:hypothetical protein